MNTTRPTTITIINLLIITQLLIITTITTTITKSNILPNHPNAITLITAAFTSPYTITTIINQYLYYY